MSAIPHPNLWIPGERFRDSLARKRNWLRRLRAPWVNFTGEDYVDATTGKLVVDATTGKQEVNSGSGNGCCLYQARDCATNTLQSLYVKKSQFPSFPSTYYFKYSGTCYYVQSSDVATCNSTPLVTGETGYASCAACGTCTPCPTTLTSPSSLLVTGWASAFGSCISGCPDFDTTTPNWDGVITYTSPSLWQCSNSLRCLSPKAPSAFERWDFRQATLYYSFSTDPCNWLLDMTGSSVGYRYTMLCSSGLTSPAGTYAFAGVFACSATPSSACLSCIYPSTLTVS